MKARRLIDGVAFGPETLKVVGQAFEAAWGEIASSVHDDPLAIEAARLSIADAVLSLAHAGVTDVEGLKNGALRLLAHGEDIPMAEALQDHAGGRALQ